MNMKKRRVIVTVIGDTSELGETTKEQLLREFNEYDPDSYDPLANLADKVIIRPYREKRAITAHLTQEEDDLLTAMANRKKISPSTLVRTLITHGLRYEYDTDKLETTSHNSRGDSPISADR